jgi:polyphenol oxidase
VFYLDSKQIYRVTELDCFEWLQHGFGTRHSDIPATFANLATLQQIHSERWVDACGRSGGLGEGDALLENSPGAAVAVKTADCVPILLVDERHRAVAAVHAGWRGTAAHITSGVLRAMAERFETDTADLHAAIGPSIGKCCYEVGPEVSVHFGEHGKTHIDLSEANRKQLLAAGVSANRVYVSNLCTRCQMNHFYSFRRDGATGRQYSFIGIVTS